MSTTFNVILYINVDKDFDIVINYVAISKNFYART